MNYLEQIKPLIDRDALFVLNHSGGKDSQAMTIVLRQIIPANQLVIVHAELPEADWPGLRAHIERYSAGIPVHYCRASKTFLGMVRDRHEKITAAGTDASPWPSPKYRQCTSDLKRGPIEKTIRAIVNAARERDVSLDFIASALMYAGERTENVPGSQGSLDAEMRALALTRVEERAAAPVGPNGKEK